jgi:hypothetical protein
MNRHHPPVAVVEHLQTVAAAPVVDAAVPELAHTIATKIERRCQQHQASDPLDVGERRVHGDEAAKARSDERHGTGRQRQDRGVHLRQHAAHGQRREVGQVEVRGVDLDAVRRELGSEERRLGRLRGRGEAVQVEDVHQSVTLQSGRQRHGIAPAPSV